jgi:hypothetical protein
LPNRKLAQTFKNNKEHRSPPVSPQIKRAINNSATQQRNQTWESQQHSLWQPIEARIFLTIVPRLFATSGVSFLLLSVLSSSSSLLLLLLPSPPSLDQL